jgi:hypothetical protein
MRLKPLDIPADSEQWKDVEAQFFTLAVTVAACPATAPELAKTYDTLRKLVKQQSEKWNMADAASKSRVYRLLYGGRTALDEVIVQAKDESVVAMYVGTGQSATPSVELFGVRVHSGDMIVSRGGAPTSALISRASDHPGNFSHVALVHVSESGVLSTIEAHIEVGVKVSSEDKYLSEKNMRLLLMRPRSDLPQLLEDPMLPHKAATYALNRAKSEYIPYDFEMDYTDPAKLFCSEVASNAYDQFGITLWDDISYITEPGFRNWLFDFGVRHFKTEGP